jgi:type I restriction enzyme S subunit
VSETIPFDRQVLGDLCLRTLVWNPQREPRDRLTYVDVSAVCSERLAVITPQELDAADAPSRARKIIQSGDTLFATVRPSLRRIALVSGAFSNALASTAFCVIRPDPKKLSPEFVFFAVQTDDFVEGVVRHERGASYPAVRDKDVFGVEIPLPSLPEQRAIAAVLSKVQEAVEVEGELVKVTRELKQVALRQLFTRGLRGEPQKETEIGLVPESWEVVRVADCILPFRFDRSQQLPASQYSATGRFPIVDQGQALIAGYCDDDSRVLHPHNPLIIFGDHTRCLKFVDFPFALGADGTKPLIARSEWDALALFYALSAVQVESRGYNRHFKQFSEKMVSRPKDIAEQRSIATILRTIDDKIAYHEERQRLMRELFRTLLHDLMTGRRRVAGAEAAASLEGVA